jgi:hypothetical protein
LNGSGHIDGRHLGSRNPDHGVLPHRSALLRMNARAGGRPAAGARVRSLGCGRPRQDPSGSQDQRESTVDITDRQEAGHGACGKAANNRGTTACLPYDRSCASQRLEATLWARYPYVTRRATPGAKTTSGCLAVDVTGSLYPALQPRSMVRGPEPKRPPEGGVAAPACSSTGITFRHGRSGDGLHNVFPPRPLITRSTTSHDGFHSAVLRRR